MRGAVSRLRSRRGIALAVWVLAAALLIVCILISIPLYRNHRRDAYSVGCASSLDSAQNQLAIDYLSGNDSPKVSDTISVVDFAMNGSEDLCPAGGTVYLIKGGDDGLPYGLACGLHDTDKKERTRLNAAYAMTLVRDRLAETEDTPDRLTVTLNGKTVRANRTEETETQVLSGLLTSDDKVKISYAVTDSDTLDPEGGRIAWFSYADTAYYAIWTPGTGWSGSSWWGVTQ